MYTARRQFSEAADGSSQLILQGVVTIAERLTAIGDRIAAAAQRSGRCADDVTLVAVSKKKPAEAIAEAHAAGQVDFGENYGQELLEKVAGLPAAIRWHHIGHLQRNKVKGLLPHVALFHGVDNARLIDTLGRCDGAAKVLLQVNVAGEASKSGCLPEEVPALVSRIRATNDIELVGLMTMPPAAGSPRRHFAKLRELAERHQLTELSMGMSHDFEIAVEEGATIVRVGSAIFGPR